jgi:translation initiation factor IF-3
VEVAPLANPPVCRIMDYGKFKFDSAQRAKESRRKTSNVGIKEMKYRPKIGPGDFDTKTRQVLKFLNEGHKVKVTVMFRGREVFHPELGKRILDRIGEQIEGVARIETEARLDGRNMVMVLAPDKRAKQSTEARTKPGEEHVQAPAAAATATAGTAQAPEPAVAEAAVAQAVTEPAVVEATVTELAVSEPAVSGNGAAPVPDSDAETETETKTGAAVTTSESASH